MAGYTVDYTNGLVSIDKAFSLFGRLSKSVAGSSNVALSDAENGHLIFELTGALTGNIEVQPTLKDGMIAIVYNNTSGGFTMTWKSSSGTGVVIATGKTAIVYCDGTNWRRVTADNP